MSDAAAPQGTPDAADLDEADDDAAWGPDAGRAGNVLRYLALQIVDEPEGVAIDTSETRNGGVKLSLRVSGDDMGKVIGRRGRVAQAIRSVVRAAGAVDHADVSVDIVD